MVSKRLNLEAKWSGRLQRKKKKKERKKEKIVEKERKRNTTNSKEIFKEGSLE